MEPDGQLRQTDLFGVDELLEPPMFLTGGGDLAPTAQDRWHFCQMMLRGGRLDGVRVLGRLLNNADFNASALGTWADPADDGVGFRLGLAVAIDLVRIENVGPVGEHWWERSASTIFWIDPAENLIAVFMTLFMLPDVSSFRDQPTMQ